MNLNIHPVRSRRFVLRRDVVKYDNNVISVLEMGGIFIFFVALLILFFPKDKIEQMVHKETSNYQLSIRYLTNIIHSYPEDTKAKLMLAQLYVKTGQYDQASYLLEGLPLVDEYKKKILYLQLELLKGEYFSSKSTQKSKSMYKDIENVLRKLSVLSNSEYDLERLLVEAKRMNLQFLIVDIEVKMIQKGYYTSEEGYKTLQKAQYLKMDHAVKTILSLSEQFKDDLKWLMVAGTYYENEKKYTQAIEIYEHFLEKNGDKTRKKLIFLKVLSLHSYLHQVNEVQALVHKYESFIYSDDELVKQIIMFYLGQRELDLAKEVSLKWYQLYHTSKE